MLANKVIAIAAVAILGILTLAFVIQPYLKERDAERVQQAALSYQAEYEHALQDCLDHADGVMVMTCKGSVEVLSPSTAEVTASAAQDAGAFVNKIRLDRSGDCT